MVNTTEDIRLFLKNVNGYIQKTRLNTVNCLYWNGMKMKQSSYYLYGAAVLIIVGLVVFAVNQSQNESAPSLYQEFAQCLTQNEVTMYGAWWCPHCEKQKNSFGSAFKEIHYVECSTASRAMNQTCRDAGITGYPTWQFKDASRLGGEQSFETLAEKSGCVLPNQP